MREIIRDESGMTMALAVIMVALLGVLGAGLLVFATADLTNVVESNQGQRAFEMADAGVQAAQQKLEDDTDNLDGWKEGDGEDGLGMKIEMDESVASVTIEPTQQEDGDDAAASYTVTSIGNYRDAMRVVEAKFSMVSSGDGGLILPPQIGTAGNIQVNGNLNLNNQFIFAGGDIQLAGSKPKLTGNVSMFAGGNFDWVNYNAPDAPSSDTSIVKDYFKNWKTETKNVDNPRPYPDTQNNVPVGIGALGKIGPKGNWSNPCATVAGKPNSGIPDWSPMRNDASIRYFDKCSERKFVENPTSANEITFPFDTYRGSDGQLYFGTNGDAQEQVVERLRQEAQNNGTYFTPNSNSAGSPFLIAKPGFTGTANYRWSGDSSLEDTVVFISFANNPSGNNTVKTQFENSCTSPFEGTIVVENGNLLTESSMDALSGAVIVKKGPDGKGGKFTSRGSCINGYVWSDGGMEIQSNAPTFNSDVSQIPGFESSSPAQATRNSWRECYSENCSSTP